jgi:hypothetical protein
VSDFRHLALHEAAHCLVATLLGVEVEDVGLRPPECNLITDEATSAYDLACVYSAGVLVDATYGRPIDTREGSDAMYAAEQVLGLVNDLDPPGTDLQYQELIRRRTKELLEQSNPALELIAEHLQRAYHSASVLSGLQVRQVMQLARAAGPKRSRSWLMAESPQITTTASSITTSVTTARTPVDWGALFAAIAAPYLAKATKTSKPKAGVKTDGSA